MSLLPWTTPYHTLAGHLGQGVFTEESSFETNAVRYPLNVTGTWTDIIVSREGSPAGASGVVWLIKNTSGGGQFAGVRKGGSTDESFGKFKANRTLRAFFSGLDGAGKAEAKTSSLAVEFYVIGYAGLAIY